MPPKKTVPTKAPAKTSGAKGAPAKTGTAKTGVTKTVGAKGGAAAKGNDTDDKPAEAPKAVEVPVVPVNMNLKDAVSLITNGEGEEKQHQESKKWPLIIDYSGNVGTFFKYRDANNVTVSDLGPAKTETLRLSLLGALRFGKPFILHIGTDDEIERTMKQFEDSLNLIHGDLLKAIHSRAIMHEDAEMVMKLVRPNDGPEYTNQWEYFSRLGHFQMVVIVRSDPPQSVMKDFFVVSVA